MYKHVLAIAGLSLVIMYTLPMCAEVLQALLNARDTLNDALKMIFSSSGLGAAIAQLISYLVIPFLAGLIGLAIHAATKRSVSPQFMLVVWVVWLIQTTALILYSG